MWAVSPIASETVARTHHVNVLHPSERTGSTKAACRIEDCHVDTGEHTIMDPTKKAGVLGKHARFR